MNEYLSAAFADFISISDRRYGLHTVTLLKTCNAFLPVLTRRRLALIFTSCNGYGFFQLAFRRILKIKIQALRRRAACLHMATQAMVKFNIAAVTLQIVEHDYEIFKGPFVHILQERNHAFAIHKVAAAGNIIWEHRHHLVLLCGAVLAAPMFLAG
ncbi:MAG: hypothetical protein AAGD92_15145 [Pseudomonadota bacterium]